MLEEHEWEDVVSRLHERRPAAEPFGAGALQRYFEITGFRETNVAAIGHHRLDLYGPPCRVCGKPLRSPRAGLCAACGASVGEPGGDEAG